MKSRYIFLASLIALGVGVWQLTSNAHQAAVLRNAVITKDQSGQDTKADLALLKNFASNHMAATIKVDLTASYSRDLAAAQAASQPSGQVYANAQKACASKADSITQARCVTDYVSKNLKPTTAVTLPDQASYEYEYKSPIWTPDAAGALLLGAAGLFALGIFSLLRRRNHRIL